MLLTSMQGHSGGEKHNVFDRLNQLGPRNYRQGFRQEMVIDHVLKRQSGKYLLGHGSHRFEGYYVVLGTVVHPGWHLDSAVVKRHKLVVRQGRSQEVFTLKR